MAWASVKNATDESRKAWRVHADKIEAALAGEGRLPPHVLEKLSHGQEPNDAEELEANAAIAAATHELLRRHLAERRGELC